MRQILPGKVGMDIYRINLAWQLHRSITNTLKLLYPLPPPTFPHLSPGSPPPLALIDPYLGITISEGRARARAGGRAVIIGKKVRKG